MSIFGRLPGLVTGSLDHEVTRESEQEHAAMAMSYCNRLLERAYEVSQRGNPLRLAFRLAKSRLASLPLSRTS